MSTAVRHPLAPTAATVLCLLAAGLAGATPAVEVVTPVRSDLSRPLAEMALIAPPSGPGSEQPLEVAPSNAAPPPFVGSDRPPGAPDAVVQRRHAAAAMPAPLLSIDGLSNPNNVLPPDANLDVGPNHVMHWVNLSFVVLAKDGATLLGPTPGSAFWTGFGGDCETRNDGDPIVLYDHLADRWLVAQFTLSRHQCVAVSSGPDPLGTWYRYDYVPAPGYFPDYPKLGVWPGGYAYTARLYQSGFVGAYVGLFERSRMLAGDPAARLVGVQLPMQPLWSPIPVDLDGPLVPPEDAPALYTSIVDELWGFAAPYDLDALLVWQLDVDWADPGSAALTESARIDLSAAGYGFDSDLCGGQRSCIPQPGTSRGLDPIPDRLMNRPQYRLGASHETIVVSHSVDASGADHAGVRWYELRNAGGGWSVHQAATYAPDADHRFMGDVAMDGAGNLALGFSVSSATTYPSVRMAGRLAGDPPGVLGLGEVELVAGGGSQTHSASRWGDYSSLSVDPSDDCTFWYTQEYLLTTGLAPWRTRIGALRLPGCGDGPRGAVAGTVVAGATGAPVVGAEVEAGGASTATGSDGDFLLDLPVGTWEVVASADYYGPATLPAVEVVADQTTAVEIQLPSGWLEVLPGRVDVRLGPGGQVDETLVLANPGDEAAEVGLHPLPRAVGRGVPPLNDGGEGRTAAPAPWPTGLDEPYGIAFDALRSTFWVGTGWATDRAMTEFLPDGTATGRIQPFVPDPLSGAAGMAFDPGAATVWVLHAGLGTCLHELDPARGATGASVCPAWPSPARGLAVDFEGDGFLVSAISAVLRRVDRSGTVIATWVLDEAASGLALNPSTGHLFALDADGGSVRVLADDGGGWQEIAVLQAGLGQGGGLALDCDGTLWAVDRATGTVHPIASGEAVECVPGPVPWLTVAPAAATVPPKTAEGLEVALAFAADAAPSFGLHRAAVRVDHDTPPPAPDVQVSLTRAFVDVPAGYWADPWIHSLAGIGVTAGCGGGAYCPSSTLSRDQMAVLVVRTRRGAGFVPPAAAGVFADVPTDHWAARYVEQLWADGVTAGCLVEDEIRYFCPDDPVTRAQMAVFVCLARGWEPLTPSGLFGDVPTDHWAAGYIERLAEEGVTAGCGGGQFCPETSITRAEIAVFLVRAWEVERLDG